MRPAVVAWLEAHGLPGWLAPDYVAMVGIAGLVGVTLFMRLARRDGADLRLEGRAIACGYLGALVGGYAIEVLRTIPDAVALSSWRPLLTVGRAAYGALLAGLLAPYLYLRHQRAPTRAFFDRLTVLLGACFACIRTGCFLAGCDYGVVTGGALGVRFPPHSSAGKAHALHGWVAAGSESLPVHPTQLYEAALGVGASAVAWWWLRRGHRDGRAFVAWVGCYAVGRFAIELLRGDSARGIYAGLSTAQLTSLALLAALALASLRGRRRYAVAAAAAFVLLLAARPADAQPEPAPVPAPAPHDASAPREPATAQPAQPAPPPAPRAHPGYPPPSAYPVGAYPPAGYGVQPATVAPPTLAPDSDLQADENAARLVGLRLTAGVTLPIARFALAAGPLVELDAVARLPVSEHHRFEVGIEVGGTFDDVAKHFAAGVPLGFVLGLASHFETSFMLVPRYSRLWFASPYFAPIDAFDGRFELGLQFPFAPHVAIGFSPLAVGVLAAPQVDTAVSLDGRLWFAAAL